MVIQIPISMFNIKSAATEPQVTYIINRF